MERLDGKKVADALHAQTARVVAALKQQQHEAPLLVAVLVGNHAASETYVASKIKACERAGIASRLVRLPETTTQAELLAILADLNADADVDGILVQLPLPSHISETAVIEATHPAKDVDGFHPENMGRLAKNLPALAPATPAGIVAMLAHYGIETKGKTCVVVGRSNVVGTPISLLMSQNRPQGNCTVITCHSHTVDLPRYTQMADILIVAAGKPGLIGKEHVRPGAVVIDVGIHRIDAPDLPRGYRIVGDVAAEQLTDMSGWLSPVPGGVGPLTIASLLQNTLQAYSRRRGIALPNV